MTTLQATSSFYIAGGTLPLDASSYVERAADRDLLASLLAGEYCYVLNSRQMGKSSLCVRTMERLRETGVRTAFLDLTKYGGRNLTAEQWYAAMLADAGRELGLRSEFLAHWKETAEIGPMQRFFEALTEVALPKLNGPIVVFVDEIDVTLSLPFSTDEFFAAIRQCYVGRSTRPELSRLTFCLLGTATPADLIQDTRVSPFNIGKRIEVGDFSAAEAAPLAEGLDGVEGLRANKPPSEVNGSKRNDSAAYSPLLSRVLHWTGGHPYLTQRLCRAAADGGAKTESDVDRVCSELFLTHKARESDDNLAFVRNRLLRSDVDLAALLDLYRKMLGVKRVPDDETNPLTSILKLSGVARVADGFLRVRNMIYGHVFDRHWLEAHMPDAEVRRQRAAYRRGLIKATLSMAVLVLVLAGLSIAAIRNGRLAADRAKQLRLERYAAQMSVAFRDVGEGNIGRASTYVDLQRPASDDEEIRGFEWRYLWQKCRSEQKLSLYHPSHAVHQISFSPDGNLIAASSWNHSTLVWNAHSGALVRRLPGRLFFSTFSPDGSLLATSSGDSDMDPTVEGSVILWNTRDWSEYGTLRGYPHGLYGLVFSPDGRTLWTTSTDRILKVWDVRNQRLLRDIAVPSSCFKIAASSDGRHIASVAFDNSRTFVLDAVSGRVVKQIDSGGGKASGATFSPDGKTLYVYGRITHVWDATTLKELRGFSGDPGSFRLGVSPDGLSVATLNGSSQAVSLWDVKSRTETRQLLGLLDRPLSVGYSPDGRYVAAGALNGQLLVWDLKEARRDSDRTDLSPYSPDNMLSISPNGRFAVSGYRRTVGALREIIVNCHDCKDRRLVGRIRFPDKPEVCFAISSDGKTLAASPYDPSSLESSKTIELWDIASGAKARELKGADSPVKVLAFTRDGKRLAGATVTKSVCEWDLATGAVQARYRGTGRSIWYLSFSPDGSRLAAGTDESAIVWDRGNKDPIREFRGFDNWTQVAFSPDSQLLATGGSISAKVWDIESGKATCPPLAGHKSDVKAVAFTPDGKTLATGSNDRSVKLWNVISGQEVGTLTGHKTGLQMVSFTEDGTLLVSGSPDQIRMWTAPPLREADSRRGGMSP
jgi:WD40 repeat protein